MRKKAAIQSYVLRSQNSAWVTPHFPDRYTVDADRAHGYRGTAQQSTHSATGEYRGRMVYSIGYRRSGCHVYYMGDFSPAQVMAYALVNAVNLQSHCTVPTEY